MINNLELYKVFYTVASTKNITEAARVLYTGQPSVSKSIKRLEESLQITLFIRSRQGVTLTVDGELLFRHIEKAMQEIDVGELAIKKNIECTSGILTLGVSAPIYRFAVLPYLKGFLEAHPNLTVNTTDNSKSYEIIEDVKAGLLDIGIVTKPPVRSAGIEFIPIANMKEIVVAAPNYLNRFDISDIKSFLEKVAFISIGKGNIMRDYSDLYLSEIGINIKPDIVTSNMNFIIELATLEVGIGIVYKQFVEQELQYGKLVSLDFLPPIQTREICIILKKNELRTFAVKEFVEYYKGSGADL